MRCAQLPPEAGVRGPGRRFRCLFHPSVSPTLATGGDLTVAGRFIMGHRAFCYWRPTPREGRHWEQGRSPCHSWPGSCQVHSSIHTQSQGGRGCLGLSVWGRAGEPMCRLLKVRFSRQGGAALGLPRTIFRHYQRASAVGVAFEPAVCARLSGQASMGTMDPPPMAAADESCRG
jgi:hypothetical protein